jgi:integrase
MAHKRAVGDGTVHPRKDGRWAAAIFAPTTAGTRKRIWVYGKTHAEADEKLTELKARIQQGVPIPDKTWRVDHYLDYWLEEIVRPARRPGTYEKDELVVRMYLKPALGSLTLPRLRVPIVQGFFNQMRSRGSSVANLHKTRTVLSAALTQAMKEELIMRNVARLVDLASYKSKKVQPWSIEEATQFLGAAESDPLYPAYLIALLYGLRRGEVLGLRWSDIDFDNNLLHIRQQLQRRSGRFIVGPVKTEASERDLRLRPMPRDTLLKHRATQEVARVEAGSAWHTHDGAEALVFTTDSGNPIDPHNFARSFHRLCERHGLRRIRVHDMRHTLATVADQLEASAKDVQFTLGHSEISTTIGKYQHGNIASSDRVAGAVEAMLIGSGGDRRSLGSVRQRVSASRQGSTRSRQIQPSGHYFLMGYLASTSGATSGIRTPDPRFTKAVL